jgi:colanic acid/amylovoran biosynthesis glycosyltransferase
VLTVAYLSNEFPVSVEPYVGQEIQELRKRGVNVIACSIRQSSEAIGTAPASTGETLYLDPLRMGQLLRAAWLCLQNVTLLGDLLLRALIRGRESPLRRLRAILHTWLGAYCALSLQGRGATHIHVHHGYFASWVAMVAARLLRIDFSMTLHGSDLLLHSGYLDTKLKHCSFCATISQFNRRYMLDHYPDVDPAKIAVCRMGVEAVSWVIPTPRTPPERFVLLAAGRLHAVKDHAFLIRACKILKERGLEFLCIIAGEGRQRAALQRLISDLKLSENVRLLGYCSRVELDDLYSMSDLVVLTSRSEGIPLVLMEAMARGKVVLAPGITGIPELVLDGKTGFLYRPGSLDDFVAKVEMIRRTQANLLHIRCAARRHVEQHFNHKKNVAVFVDVFLDRLNHRAECGPNENPVLQQI